MKSFPPFAWVLLGILAVTALVLTLGNNDIEAFPAVASYSPSGTAAFEKLLQKQGYQIRVERSDHPRLAADETAIAFFLPSQKPFVEMDEETMTAAKDPAGEKLAKFLDAGGKAVLLPLGKNFQASSRAIIDSVPDEVTPAFGSGSLKVTRLAGVDTTGMQGLLDPDATSVPIWLGSSQQLDVSLEKKGKGVALVFTDGILATNRFIDKNQNADLLVAAISTVAPKGSKLVFTEATFGNSREGGLLGIIGAWAQAAWLQLVLVCLVVVYSLSRRFGLAEEPRAKQVGSRELVDAVGDLYYRARATPLVLQTVIDRAVQDLRLRLNLPKDSPEVKFRERLPEELLKALDEGRRLAIPKTHPTEALQAAQRIDQEMEAFMGSRIRTKVLS